jgi:hypothetical protein
MTTTINASTSSGLVNTADTSGIIKVQSNGVTTNALAWINFGYVSSAITIRSQYNVSSVTRNGTGDYTLNFTNAMSDANYAAMGCYQYAQDNTASGASIWLQLARFAQTTSAVRVTASSTGGTNYDGTTITVAIFGN